jgi:hypothetical protein
MIDIQKIRADFPILSRKVNGKPLVYYPALAAANSKFISELYITSDDDKILNAVDGLGYKKIKRPSELAQPDSQAIDVVRHGVEIIRNDIFLLKSANKNKFLLELLSIPTLRHSLLSLLSIIVSTLKGVEYILTND